MTREEKEKLIRHLKYNREIGADYLITDEDADEIIKALEQEPILDKIRAEIQNLRNCSCSCSDEIIDDVEDIIDKYKAESEGEE